MTYLIRADNINAGDAFKATIIGKNRNGDKVYFVSTFPTEAAGQKWVNKQIKQHKLHAVKHSVVKHDGVITISEIDDSLFIEPVPNKNQPVEAQFVDEEEVKPKKKPLNRKWYEIFWDACRRMF